ncbi:hypothetical protein NA78x_003480 [Anatilimnocola sp. NA78]|uniref:hypothetical protein n=1 Tax=Anatilimnocola sp. NA78 TaxID=3415683 RepID=UPI003CE51195
MRTVHPYTTGMDASKLTRKQLDQLTDKLAPAMRYLLGMHHRLKERNFPADDPLVIAADEAMQRMQALLLVIHNLALAKSSGGFYVGYTYHPPVEEAKPEAAKDIFGGMSARQWKKQQQEKRNG